MPPGNRPLIIGFLVALTGAAFFALLAQSVMAGNTVVFDAGVRNAIHGWANPVLTGVMRAITELGAVVFLLPLGILVVWRLRAAGRPRAAVLFALAAVGGELSDQALKYWFRRPRPEVFFGMAQPATYSFPSGHSVASCCFYGVLAAILSAAAVSRRRKIAIWAAAALLTLAIGTSRIYLGVHYPTDVMGGYAVAVVWVFLVRFGYHVWLRCIPPSI